MIIVYTSNSGYTKQYATLLSNKLGLTAYELASLPKQCKGEDAIYMGWVMAGNVMGLGKAQKKCAVKCAVAVGMSKLDQAGTDDMHTSIGLSEAIPLFQLQGGYDINKLKGPYKMMMRLKGKDILSRLEAKGELNDSEKAMYEMVTKGYSVVSEENLAPVIKWYEER